MVELIALRVGARQADPARAAGRARDRHRRARRRVGVVVRVVDDRVALEHARRGRRLRARGGRGGRRDRRRSSGARSARRRSLRSPSRASRCRPRSSRSWPWSRTPRRSRPATRSSADVTLTDVKPAPKREVNVRGRARPGRRRRRRLLVRDHRLAGQGGPLARRADGGGLARRLAQHRAGAGVRRLEVDAAPAQGLRDPGPRGLLPRGQGDPGQGGARPSRASRASSSATSSCSSASRRPASRRLLSRRSPT